MNVLALDLATATGYAWGEHNAVPRYGLLKLPSGSAVGKFVSTFADWFDGFVGVEKPEWCVFEAPLMMHGPTANLDATRKLMGLAAQVEVVCYRRDVPCREANVSTVKKFWAGDGRAKKPEMVGAARARGFDVSDHNVADALAVWAYQVHQKFVDQRHRWAAGALGVAS